eukprot:TRINITY_DN8606_c1_g1_i6.p1 TRINITY_DN8606_c1_g1~~TRINITY_DN8606_c1_g1_i6.p1  ORF type:complete len:307 (+),score=45.52 TRINITY_DN8606_c1_g1_i6:105-923(+)
MGITGGRDSQRLGSEEGTVRFNGVRGVPSAGDLSSPSLSRASSRHKSVSGFGRHSSMSPRRQSAAVSSEVVAFGDVQIHAELMRGVRSLGLGEPSPLQQRALPTLLSCRDAVVQAPPGRDRDATVAIALLQRIDWAQDACQGLVLCPTREAAWGLNAMISDIGKRLGGGDFCHRYVAGASFQRGVVVAVGTPECVSAAVQLGSPRRRLRLQRLRVCVLDSLDVMLEQGLNGPLHRLAERMPPSTQFAAFSETAPTAVRPVYPRRQSQLSQGG